MDFNEKLAAARRLLAGTGIHPSNYAPPLYRLLWRTGARVPPPHFRSFLDNALLMGGCFGMLMGIAIGSGLLPTPASTSVDCIIMGLVFGGLFGPCMALYYRHGAHSHAIPAWNDFHPTTD